MATAAAVFSIPPPKEITIQKDSSGLYLMLDFFYSKYTYARDPKMLLTFSNSHILVSGPYCLSFNNYYCSDTQTFRYCPANDAATTILHHPTFRANATLFNKLPIFIEGATWPHGKDIFLTRTCFSGSMSYGSSRAGVIGMGIKDNSPANSSSTFSVYLNKDLTGGKLFFDYNSTNAKWSSPLEFASNSSWQIHIGQGKLSLGSQAIPISGNLMFDIHADTIAFPLQLYNNFIELFKSTHGVKCEADESLEKKACYYSGSVSNLKTLSITIDGKSIEIPSDIYAKTWKGVQNKIYLNIRATDPVGKGSNTINPMFMGSIILNAECMSYFYSVFIQKGDQHIIKIYLADHNPFHIDLSNLTVGKVMFFGYAVGLLAVIFCLCRLACTKRKKPAYINRQGSDIQNHQQTNQAHLSYPGPQDGSYQVL